MVLRTQGGDESERKEAAVEKSMVVVVLVVLVPGTCCRSSAAGWEAEISTKLGTEDDQLHSEPGDGNVKKIKLDSERKGKTYYIQKEWSTTVAVENRPDVQEGRK